MTRECPKCGKKETVQLVGILYEDDNLIQRKAWCTVCRVGWLENYKFQKISSVGEEEVDKVRVAEVKNG